MPVKICVIKHNPKREPKFHKNEIDFGVGISIRDELTINIIG